MHPSLKDAKIIENKKKKRKKKNDAEKSQREERDTQPTARTKTAHK